MNPEELLALFAQLGVPPEQRMAMLMQIMQQAQQPIDPFMATSDYKVKDANKLVDYGHDINTLMADPMTAASAGMDAYGGANALGYQAFDPVTGPAQPVAAPDRQLLDRYLSRPTTDIGGWIADQIANSGATAFEVVGQLQQILNHGPWTDPELEARRTQLAQMVPSYTDPDTQQTRWDYSGIETLANKLEEQSVAQPEPGSYQDAQGNWWQQGKTEDSPMTQWYQKQGLPLPTQRYTLEDFTPEGAQYQQRADALKTAYDAQAGARSGLDDRMKEAYQTLLMTREQARQADQQKAAATATPRALSPDPAEYTAFLNQQRTGHGSTPPAAPGYDWQGVLAQDNADRAKVGGPQLSMNFTGQQMPQPPVVSPATQGNQYLQGQSGNLTDLLTDPLAFINDQRLRNQYQQTQAVDPDRTKTAMKNYLDLARAHSQMGQVAIDQWKAQQQANGRRFWDVKTQSYAPDTGVAQGRLNYAAAQATGRTPTQDALRARAMAALMLGG